MLCKESVKGDIDDPFHFGSDDEHDDDESISDTDDHEYPPYHSGAVSFTPNHSNPLLYVLGLSYHPTHDYTIRREDESRHLIWFTYRSEFEEIAPYGIKSDAG